MKIAIVGTVGVPGRYGGFETLAENLVRQHQAEAVAADLTVYCSAQPKEHRPARYLDADLRYSRFKANGFQSTIYDAVTLVDAARNGQDVTLVLGVSGAIALPLIRLFSPMRIVTNVDGIEWRRDKWKGPARHFLRLSEWMAVRFSHEIVADNQGIADHLRQAYGVVADVIAYGGDHAVAGAAAASGPGAVSLPAGYALSLCRIEPENNVAAILEAFASAGRPLVFVGNWNNSAYGRALRAEFGALGNLRLLDPVYETDALYRLRSGAGLYVHGHSAGGTNPSLVEMMHFGIPILAFDCVYNRHTTENAADYFSSAADLARLAQSPIDPAMGTQLRETARRLYSWHQIGRQYFDLLGVTAAEPAREAAE
ncbi:MAG: glycosyl transferase [Rhizobiales bacterium]|nr:glycosyl transferase [Hyphomicrobiales bacterium]MBA69616.1 glycosyl transferase [Hyphomicrobiales bacterium]